MPIKIHLPIPWRRYCNGAATVAIEAKRVSDALRSLEMQYPDLKGRMLEGTRAHPALNILRNGTDVRLLDNLSTRLQSGDELLFILEFGRG